jgi:hypothetical protein
METSTNSRMFEPELTPTLPRLSVDPPTVVSTNLLAELLNDGINKIFFCLPSHFHVRLWQSLADNECNRR